MNYSENIAACAKHTIVRMEMNETIMKCNPKTQTEALTIWSVLRTNLVIGAACIAACEEMQKEMDKED